jgi:O-antigen biosynthesis protein WbqP
MGEFSMKQSTIKRTLDCVLAVGGIVCLLPVLGGAMLLCARSGEGIIYRQKRIGQGGVPFIVYKFRTMRRDAPILPRDQLSQPEQYYITGGAFLRSTGIDELPQLFNVLKGEMSLIGPRPLLPSEEVAHRLRAQYGIYELRPGITGLAQLCGDPPPPTKVKLDRLYLENASLSLDSAIVLATLRLLLHGRRPKEKIPRDK